MRKRPDPADRPVRPHRSVLRHAPTGTARWAPLLLLLLSLGIAAVALVQAQRAVRSHRATAEGLLRDYAAFAAWSYRQQAAELLSTAFHQTLDAVHHDRHRDRRGAYLPVDVLQARQESLADSTCKVVRPGAPYYFRLGPDGRLTFAGPPPSPAVQRWLADTIPAHLRRSDRRGEEVWISGRVEGKLRHVIYAIPGEKGDPRYVYGFELDPARYHLVLRAALGEKPLLPAALMKGRKNDDLLAVRVVAPGGAVLYESDPRASWVLGSADTLPARFGGLAVQAAVRSAVAESLIIGGLPRSRLPLLAGLLLLAAGLAAVAVWQLRREGELARLRSDFVSSVSHELRTPLAQVRLFLETMRLGRYSTEPQREWLLDNMERETTRLTNLVDNVLHFSRAERGASGGEMERVELAEYLEQVVSSFAPLAASRRVRFETSFEPGLLARLDPGSFRQVILNLLDNAVKYGPQGQRVRVSAAFMDGRVRIAVEDQGPGVEPTERESIWEPFRRGRRAVGSVAVGSGIGLSVVREIVRWHAGEAWVEEGETGGARFAVDLPGWRKTSPRGEVLASGTEALREAV
jgi:signal transduction histidine kinase